MMRLFSIIGSDQILGGTVADVPGVHGGDDVIHGFDFLCLRLMCLKKGFRDGSILHLPYGAVLA